MPLKRLLPVVATLAFSLALPASALADPPASPTTSTAPPAVSNQTSASITLQGIVDGATIICSLDGSSYSVSSCGFGDDPLTVRVSGLSDGIHLLYIRQQLVAGESSDPLEIRWLVDSTAPSAPNVTSPTEGGYTDPSFTLGATFDSGTRLQCRLDPTPESGWGNCPGISDGTAYTAGWNTQLHWGENPTSDLGWFAGYNNQGWEECASAYWDNDKNACWDFPLSASTDTSMAGLLSKFGFTDCASAVGGLTKTDLVFGTYDASANAGIGKWNVFNLDCTNTTAAITASFKDLSLGAHTLDVRAVDAAGNASSPTSINWTVGTPPSTSAESQRDEAGNLFINADVLEFGSKANASFGTDGFAPIPEGFHLRTEMGEGAPTNGLGFVAPADPVTKDWSNQLGDFFTPGSPYEGWRLAANGEVAANNDANTSIEGVWENVIGSDHSATWESTSPWNGLHVSMTYSTPGTDQLIHGSVVLTNSSSSPVTGVAFARGVDPDNCVMDRAAMGGGGDGAYDTTNTIFSQYGVDSSAISVITATASCNNETLLSLSSSDPGSRVGVYRGEWARGGDPFALLNSDGSDYAVDQGEVVEGDSDINLAIPAKPGSNNTLQPGESVTLHFTYSLSRPALSTLGVSEVPPPHITKRPDAFTTSSAISVEFTKSDETHWNECKVDSYDWQPCSSPYEPSGFSEGAHHGSIREVSYEGVRGPIASFDWTVDTQAPNAPTLSGGVVGETTSRSSTITINGEDGATFACSFDGSDFAACSSPVTVNDLTLGDHILQVKQTDRAGNESSTRGVAWTIINKPTSPVIKGAPYVATQAGWIDLAIESDPSTTITCSIDGGLFAPCGIKSTVPGVRQYLVSLSNLRAGTHSLAAKAVTIGGTLSDATTVTWTVGTSTSPLVFGKAPTVTTKKDSGRWAIKLTVSSGTDRRPASQPLTVQLSTDVTKPADNLTPPKVATYSAKVVRYAASFNWSGKQKPRWLRIGNKAGRWSNWQAIANG